MILYWERVVLSNTYLTMSDARWEYVWQACHCDLRNVNYVCGNTCRNHVCLESPINPHKAFYNQMSNILNHKNSFLWVADLCLTEDDDLHVVDEKERACYLRYVEMKQAHSDIHTQSPWPRQIPTPMKFTRDCRGLGLWSRWMGLQYIHYRSLLWHPM